MDNLKDALARLQDHLSELETSARQLPNQNFADIIKSAKGRLAQASEHPDLEAAGDQLRADLYAGQERFPFDPNAGNDTQGGGY